LYVEGAEFPVRVSPFWFQIQQGLEERFCLRFIIRQTKGGTLGNLSSSDRVIFDGDGAFDWEDRYNVYVGYGS